MQSNWPSSHSWVEEYETRLKEYYQYCEENGREAICLCKRCKGNEIHPVKLDGGIRKEEISKIEGSSEEEEWMNDFPSFFRLDLDSMRYIFSYLDMRDTLSVSMVCSKFWNIYKQYLVKNVCFSIGYSEQSIKRLNNNLIKRYVCNYEITDLEITIDKTNIKTLVRIFERGNQIKKLDVKFYIDSNYLNKVNRIIQSLVHVSRLKIEVDGDYEDFYIWDYTLHGIYTLESTLKELTLLYFHIDGQSLQFSSLTKLELLDTNIKIDDVSGIPPNLKTLALNEYFYPEVAEFRYLENLMLNSHNPDNLPDAPLLTSLHAQTFKLNFSTLFSKYPKLKRLYLDSSVDLDQIFSLCREQSTTQLEALEITIDEVEEEIEEIPNFFTMNFPNLTHLTFNHNILNHLTKVFEDIAQLKCLISFQSNDESGNQIVKELSHHIQVINTTSGIIDFYEPELLYNWSVDESSPSSEEYSD